jgi:hypothetical protein
MNEVFELQALAVTDEVAGLKRRSRKSGGGHGGTKTTCLISLNGSVNDLTADVLNIFGGAF